MQIESNLTHAKPNAVCYRTSESPILAKTFVWVVWQLQNRRLLMFWEHRYDLTFVGMIMVSVSKEAAKCLCFLKRCKKYFTPSDLRTIYVTYIRPKMKYNLHLWAGASESALDFVDRIQNRALKVIPDDRIASSLTSLRLRRNVSCIVPFYK